MNKEKVKKSLKVLKDEGAMSSWLTLQEYSNKQGVSISTLRRKIKANEIEHKRRAGKYYIKFNEELGEKKELKNYYTRMLEEKDDKIKKLLEEKEDLLSLLEFLEQETRVLRSKPYQAQKS